MIRTPRWIPAGLVVVALSGAAIGCGSGPPMISAGAAAELSQQVRAVRSAATAGNRADAQAQLDGLRSDVATLQAQHEITSDRAAQILSAASAVSSALAITPTAVTTPSTPTTAATEVPATRASQTDSGKKGKQKHGG